MTDKLYLEEIRLEEEARGLTIQRFHREHLNGVLDGTFSETFLGSYLITNYLNPFTQGIESFVTEALSGKAGNNNRTAKFLRDIDPAMVSFLMLKAIFNKVTVYNQGKPCTLTGLALYGAGLIHDEVRLRQFDEEHRAWSQKIHKDFNRRELPRYKREEYMQGVFRKADLEWSLWSKAEQVKIGVTLLSIFRDVSGDLFIETVGAGKAKRDVVRPSEGLVEAVQRNADHCEAMFTTYFPMVVPPVDWSADTLSSGGYCSHNVAPYPLVKSSKRVYRDLLLEEARAGNLNRVFDAVNALQRTPWSINTRVLDVVEEIYSRNIPCGKLPRADPKPLPPIPQHLEGRPEDDDEVREHKALRFQIHEHNRRIVGKRVVAARSFHLARKFSKYEEIYFPHDLDSRGRVYPKPSGINPQGPDYVKGLLQFAKGKALGPNGVRWLAIHGANSWGEDKLPLDERQDWGESHLELARSVAEDPLSDLRWTQADAPVQFLAWCFEWAEAHRGNPEEFISHLHVDLDATCSGLQHFSAMLRDEVGGRYVNMTPAPSRKDVYQEVANKAIKLIQVDLGSDDHFMASAWMDFGVSRKITKRPVMVKPYAGTRQSCTQYVSEAVEELLKEGHPLPVPEENIWAFKLYGAGKVWEAIPEVVVAADKAMQWLMKVARLVGRSQPDEKRIEWVTPMGLPVHQYKFNLTSRQIATFFDGKRVRPRITEETDRLDPRQMATSVAPSFVHSLDAAHLQATISAAHAEGLEDFAVVHDSFGVHACDVDQFSRVIREEFVEIYEGHDVLREFRQSAFPLISDDLLAEVPPIPSFGALDLRGVIENEFFFS